MEPGAQPACAEPDGEDEPEPQAPTQTIEGHGQVLLLGNLCEQEERFLTLQDILEQSPASGPAEPSSTRATCGHSSSSDCSRRRLRLKRSSDSCSRDAEGPAAKCGRPAAQKPPQGRRKAEDPCWGEREPARAPSGAANGQRCAQKPPQGRRKAEDPCGRERESAPAPAPAAAAAAAPWACAAEDAAEDLASGCAEPPEPEPAARLLLVLCRAAALRSQLPRLQLLLQRAHARHRSPPAALVGIVVLPRREEEAEARRRMETLLCGAFAPHRPAVEVHTALFSPCRPEGTLDIQRAAAHGAAHEASTGCCVPLLDRETQTEEDQQGNIRVIVIPMLQVLGTAAVALGALATAYYVIELL